MDPIMGKTKQSYHPDWRGKIASLYLQLKAFFASRYDASMAAACIDRHENTVFLSEISDIMPSLYVYIADKDLTCDLIKIYRSLP